MKNVNKKLSWLNKDVFILLTGLFLIAQTLGLIVAQKLILLDIKSAPITGDLNNPLEAIYLIVMILIMTTFILILLKYKKNKSLWIFEALAIFSTSIIVFGSFFPKDDSLVFLITIVILAFRYTHKENKLFKNFVSILAISGAGAILGISLGLIPVLIFIILLSIYDFIAVFKTKHMVTMGKSIIKQNLAFTLSIPTKKHNFELGNGDLVIPLIVATSVFANGFFMNNFLVAILCLIASYIGIMFSIYTVSVKKIPLPALPPQTALMVLVIIISFLLGL